MSVFAAKLTVSNLAIPDRKHDLELMVDTGAAFSWISRQHLESLGIRATGKMNFTTIEGHVIEREVAPVLVSVDGRSGGDTVVVAEPGDYEVCGAHTLEAMGMAADPVHKKLIPLTVALAL